MESPDYLEIYHLEDYLLTKVGGKFRETGTISLIDFYLITIWKAPRAKGYVRARLKKIGDGNCAPAVNKVSQALWHNNRPEERLRILMGDEFGFRLATATAILTILDPEHFSVYDKRVCEQLRNFRRLADQKFSSGLWHNYQLFLEAVKAVTPGQLTLRDKDRYLWGKSFYEEAEKELNA